MSAYAAPAPSITPTDRLSVTLFFAVCAHLLVVLGVTFVKEDRHLPSANTLDVVLVQRQSEEEPEDADFIGQANQLGGGESDRADRPQTPLPSPLLSNEADIAAASRPVVPSTPVRAEPTPEPEPDVAPAPTTTTPTPVVAVEKKPAARAEVVRQPEVKTPTPEPEKPRAETVAKKKPAKAPPERRPKVAEKPAPAPAPQAEAAPVQTIDAAALVRRSLKMASLAAEVGQRMNAYAKRPRRTYISANTRKHKYAAYMEAWRAKVERIGNLNYPDEARRKRLSGELQLDVALNADGSVRQISVRRSSGHKVLDDAARRIVKLAAPYARFPKSIREETDILHIQRTWRFLNSNQFASR